MAVTQENLLIQISANTDKATAAIDGINQKLEGFEAQLKKSHESQKKSADSLSDFGMVATKVNAAMAIAQQAFSFAGAAIGATVGEFQKAKAGVQSLADTLSMMGEKNINKSLEKFLSLADQIENTTMIDGDTVVSMAKLGVAAGRTDSEIDKMVRTAVNMAAVTGGDAKNAMNALIASFTGQKGELEKLTPELKNMTQAQVMAGGAVDLLAEKFKGAGAAAANTYAGQMQQIANKTGAVMEEIGKILSVGFDFEDSTKSLNNIMGVFLNTLKDAGPEIAAALGFIKALFDNTFQAINIVLLEAGKSVLYYMNMLAEASDSLSSVFGKKTNFSGFVKNAKDQLEKVEEYIIDSLVTPMKAAEKARDDYSKNIAQKMTTGSGDRTKAPVVVSDESKRLLEELQKKAEEVQKQSLMAATSEFGQIKLKAQLELDDLDTLEKKLKIQNALNGAAKDALKTARDAINARSDKEQAASMQKTIDDLQSKTKANDKAFAQANMTEFERYKADINSKLEELDKVEKDLKKEGKLPSSGPLTQDQQAIADNLQAQRNQAMQGPPGGPSKEYLEAKDVGDQIGKSMTEAFQGPTMSAISGAAAGAMRVIGMAQGVIDMAQSIVDAIPKLLNSFANLVNSITDLPTKIAEGIANVFNSVLNLIRNFIPNIVKMFRSIIESIVDFVKKAPEMFIQMVNEVDELLTSFIEDLPMMLSSIAEGLTAAIPKIMAKSIETAFKTPKLLASIVKMFYTELPPAIWHGIMEGFKEFGRSFQKLMKGQKIGSETMKLDVDTEDMKKKVEQLTKDTSKLFAVSAIEDAAKNATNEVKKIDQAAKKAGKTMWNHFVQALIDGWRWFMQAGQKIWNGLVEAVGVIADTFGAWGTAIWDGLLKPIGETFGEWGTKIWNGLVTAVGVLADTFGAWGTAIWDGLLKPIGETFGDWGTKIWNGFLKPVGETFGDWGTKIWNGFIKPIGDSFSKFGTAIIDSFKNGLPEILKSATTLFTGLADTFKKLFKFDFSGLKTAITEAFNSGSAAIKDGFKSVINPIIDVFNGLIDALNAMQIPELKWAINAGRIGSWSGTLIPAVDLLPNIDPIKKFAQGGLVTGPMGTDAVPSLLTAGEFVINKRAANGIGLSNLIAMNSGKPVGNTTQNITLNLSLNSKEKLDENFVRQRLMPAIREELKRGSLDGRAIVYAGGVRS